MHGTCFCNSTLVAASRLHAFPSSVSRCTSNLMFSSARTIRSSRTTVHPGLVYIVRSTQTTLRRRKEGERLTPPPTAGTSRCVVWSKGKLCTALAGLRLSRSFGLSHVYDVAFSHANRTTTNPETASWRRPSVSSPGQRDEECFPTNLLLHFYNNVIRLPFCLPGTVGK